MNPSIKAVAFDVDGTLVDSSMWITLHRRFGFSPEDDARLLRLYHENKITFREWMDAVAEIYASMSPPLTKGEIEAIWKGFVFIPGAEGVVAELKKRYPIALISSGFTDYVDPVAQALSVPHAYAFMRMRYREDGTYGGMEYLSHGDELSAKVDALDDFAAKIGIEAHEIAFVGDSINDLGAFRHTGKGILVGDGTPEMREAAWKKVATLPEVLDIL